MIIKTKPLNRLFPRPPPPHESFRIHRHAGQRMKQVPGSCPAPPHVLIPTAGCRCDQLHAVLPNCTRSDALVVLVQAGKDSGGLIRTDLADLRTKRSIRFETSRR